jgi:molybdenum-dependent DNA-binding transcriptional regulator ModE
MEILEAYDVTGSLRGAAALAGCDHKTVAHWVRAREEAGGGVAVSESCAAAGRRVRGEDR